MAMLSEIDPDNKSSSKDAVAPVSTARRRLLRGSLAAAPVILTVASRPVLAGTTTCMTGSAWTSANPMSSGRTSKAQTCSGLTPSSWATTNARSWPSNLSPTTTFKAAFGVDNYTYGAKSLLNILKLTNPTDTSAGARVAQHLTAALLNARCGRTTLMSETYIKNIWLQYSTNGGTYSPTAGVVWYADTCKTPTNGKGGLITWLKTTMS